MNEAKMFNEHWQKDNVSLRIVIERRDVALKISSQCLTDNGNKRQICAWWLW